MAINKKQIIIVVGIILNADGKLLLSRRINNTEFPATNDKWEFVGGKIEFGEDPESAIVREVLEETGLQVEVTRLLPKIFSNNWNNLEESKLQAIIISYECKITGGALQETNFDPKIGELRFVPISELANYSLTHNVSEIIKLLNT